MPSRTAERSPAAASPVSPSPMLRVPGTSLHRQLFLVLRDRVVSGDLQPGEALPKEESLCRQFGVSRITVRRALADLAAQRLVQSRHGLGTFVLPGAVFARAKPTLSFVDDLRRMDEETKVRVIAFAREVPPKPIATLLNLPTGEAAIHAARLRSGRGLPLMLTDAWVPADVGKGITRSALAKKPMYELLMQSGVRFGRVVQEISAESASPDHARALATEVGAALLRVVRLLHDRQGRPVQHLTVYMSPERSRLLMEIRPEDIDTLKAGFVVHDPVLATRS